MDPIQETKPLFATQGGGYAVFEGGRYVWYGDIPGFINAQPGDPIPSEWGVVAVNRAAYEEMEMDREIADELRELGLQMSACDR